MLLLVTSTSACAQVQPLLPNSCSIVATQAYFRLEDANWRALLSIRFLDPHELFPLPHGHTLCVWQPLAGHHILIYDSTGTVELDTTSHDLKDVTNELMLKCNIVIFSSHYL